MTKIRFQAELFKIHDWTIVRIPDEVSDQLPSRGMLVVQGTFDGKPFKTPLEPDGRGRHWFKVEPEWGGEVDESVAIEIEPTKDWPRPVMPDDIRTGIAKVPEAQALYERITPAAQWEWLRWIRSTNNPETRANRILVSADKLRKGIRRPCCFNRNLCTEPYVAQNWQLAEPAEVAK